MITPQTYSMHPLDVSTSSMQIKLHTAIYVYGPANMIAVTIVACGYAENIACAAARKRYSSNLLTWQMRFSTTVAEFFRP
jgi:hypothetical protein